MSTTPDIEALAHELAEGAVYDWVAGDNWYGYPDPGNVRQWEEAVQEALPRARETAEHYLKIAGVL